MTKAYFSFNLDDPDEKIDYEVMSRARSYHSALWDIGYEILRNKRKYGEYGEEASKLLDLIEEEFWETISSYNIDLS